MEWLFYTIGLILYGIGYGYLRWWTKLSFGKTILVAILFSASTICFVLFVMGIDKDSIYKSPLKVKDYKMRTEIRTEILNDSIVKRDTIYVFYLTKLNILKL